MRSVSAGLSHLPAHRPGDGIAKGEGFFSGEIAPVELPPTRKGPVPPVADDEHPRPNTDLETLARMRPLYEGGVTTAGNASGVNDGAVALLLGSKAAGDKAGIKPMVCVIGDKLQSRIRKAGNGGVIQDVRTDEDGWTARTLDGTLAAHFENSIAITANGPKVLGRPAA